jgi:hypothetical protein
MLFGSGVWPASLPVRVMRDNRWAGDGRQLASTADNKLRENSEPSLLGESVKIKKSAKRVWGVCDGSN